MAKNIQLKDASGNVYPNAAGYIPGDTITPQTTLQLAGSFVSSTSLRFSIPLCKSVSNCNGVSVSGGILIRCGGNLTTISDINASGQTGNGIITIAGIDVNIVFDTSPGIAPHTPLIVQPSGLKITFS